MLKVYEDITQPLIDLFGRHQIQVVEEQYEPQSFGDYLLLGCSDTKCIQLIRDRGEWSIYIQFVTGERFSLQEIAERLSISGINYETPIERLIEFLDAHYDEIV